MNNYNIIILNVKKQFCLYYLLILFTSCNRIDLSNPQDVIKAFNQYPNREQSAILYDNYLSEKSKQFVTRDEFIKSVMYQDSDIKRIKLVTKNILPLPIDITYPSYRRFKIEQTILFKKYISKTRDYYTLINENGKWKIIWTNTLLSFADQKSFNGDCEAARKTAEKIIELNPFDGSAYRELATCYYRDNSLPKYEWENGVVKNIKYALSLEEDNLSHYNILASYYSQIQQYDLAIQIRLNALKYCLNESDKAVIYTNIGNSYQALNKYNSAFEYQKKALEIDYNYTDAWYRLGMLMEQQGTIDPAIMCFKKAILLPKMENELQASLYYEYSKCLYKKNKCTEAKQYIDKALIIDPSNDTYQYLYNIVKYCN